MLDPKKRRKFILATWEGGGSVGPVLTVARKLIAAGHDVRVMSDACNRLESEAVGARFVPYTRAPSRPDKSPETEVLADWKASDLPGVLDMLMEAIAVAPALAYARDLIEELGREPADLVVSNELVFGVPLGCEAAGQPFALLCCNSVLFPLEGAPQAGPPPVAEPTDEERAGHEADMAALGAVFARHLPTLNAARAELGLPAIDNLFAQLEMATKTLVAVSRTFDFGPAIDNGHFAYVGPQIDELAWAEPWISPWQEPDPRPLVLVGFSTTFQNHAANLQRVVDALGRLPVRAVVTLGPSIQPGGLVAAENVRLMRSAPHSLVMQQADLVVTHGGHGTVARAMANKLPMLVMPHGRDQDGNAARVVAHGAGLALPPDAPARDIAQAVDRLLSDPTFAANAKRLGVEVEREMRESRVVSELESLCQPAFA